MTEIKKTRENLPSRMLKKIVSLSESNSWEESQKEWEMKEYYYVSQYHSCLCSPREVHNITVIENIHNSNQMDICNSCANLYFGIVKSLKIEAVVRRLKKDIELNMDDICLAYLLENRIINTLEHKNYKLIRLSRKDGYNRFYREKINRQLVHFTDYANKFIFEKLEILIAWSTVICNQHYVSVFVKLREELLDTGQTDVAYLDGFVEKNGIELLPLARQDKDLVLKTIGEHKRTTLDLEEYVRTSKRRLTKNSTKHVLSPFCLEGLEEADPSEIISHEETEEEYEAKRRLARFLRISANNKNETDLKNVAFDGVLVSEKESSLKEKEVEPYMFRNAHIPQEIKDTCKLSPENLDYVYTFGGAEYKWESFNQNILFPIKADDDIDRIALLLYDWFVEQTSLTLLSDFFRHFEKGWVKYRFVDVPFRKDLVETDYIRNFLKLIDFGRFCELLDYLCEGTLKREDKEKWVAKLNDVFRKHSYEFIQEVNRKSYIRSTSLHCKAIPVIKKTKPLEEYIALSPFDLVNHNEKLKDKSYRCELFGNTYWEFHENSKHNWKFKKIDKLYSKSSFPFGEKVLLRVAYYMYEWCVEVIKSPSFYYMSEYFDDYSFSVAYDSVARLFFPLSNNRQWINMFWILSLLKESEIELLLGELYLGTEDEKRLRKVRELDCLLKEEGYEATYKRRMFVYIELTKVY